MIIRPCIRACLLACCLLAGCLVGAESSASGVRLSGDVGHLQLLRDGQPFTVRGAGADVKWMNSLAKAGGNSVRLWGDENLGPTLDAAQALGLTVCAGFWAGQVRQGFDWTNADALAQQRERLRATVTKYKDHPALLIWAIGNEAEDPQGTNEAVWKGLNDLAAMVKAIDRNHPTMTVIAEIGGDKVKNIHRLCPAIDIIGINSYGGAATLGARYQKLGGAKPYIVTEFGPPGIWEIGKNPLGAYDEPISTQKAAIYRAAYEGAVTAQPGICLGSYAFYWGLKQEVTSTWFSMLLDDGTRLGPVDAMSEIWTGKAPANRCPVIAELKVTGLATVDPGAVLNAALVASDPEGDSLEATWMLQRDAQAFGTGGATEAKPQSFPDAIVRGDLKGAQIRLPEQGGLYRLCVTVRDGHGGAAAANVPLRVNGPAVPIALGNISTRLSVGTGENVLIGGFIITGTQSKKVIVRAIGPSLPMAGTLSDPSLELHDGSGALVGGNDDWRENANQLVIASTIPPANARESALLMTLDPGAYTAIVRGVAGGTGVGLVDAYDLDQTADSNLTNVSTRGPVGSGDDVLIGGVIVLGTTPATVLVRAIGPSLAGAGVAGALADPVLEFHDATGAVIASNDNWRTDDEANIQATGLAPPRDAESAILATLAPGSYTAVVRGANGTTGIGLVEIYDLRRAALRG